MQTNASVVHPITSFAKSVICLFDKKLESKVLTFDEAKKLISELNGKNFYVCFSGEHLKMKKESVLNFLDMRFREADNEESIAKYESFQTNKRKINYLWMYKNHLTLKNENEIIFATYMTPLRATISYFD